MDGTVGERLLVLNNESGDLMSVDRENAALSLGGFVL
jgi:hypothetical protein